MPLSEPNSTSVPAITGGEGLVGIPLTSGGDDHVGAVNVSTTPSPAVVSPASVSSAIPTLPLPDAGTSTFTEARDAAARAGDSWKANLFDSVDISITDNKFLERHLPGWRVWLDFSQDGPDMLIYRGPDGQRLNRAQFASWLQSTKVELLAMPVMRIDGRMHHARVPLSYIGPDGQHLDIELNFACGSGHTLECV